MVVKRYTWFWWFFVAVTFINNTSSYTQNYLSNLHATKNDPLYATYAAAINNSQYIVDEGYQFIFFNPDNGINLETDSAGNLCLAWKMGEDFRYYLNQMYRQPIIHASYSNLVKYEFMPYDGIKVEVLFLVKSSQIAIQDLTINNISSERKTFSLFPFFENRNDVIKNAVVAPGKDLFAFTHVEPPDAWTLQHGVPYVDELINVYILSDTADYYGGYENFGDLPASLRKYWTKSLPNYCVEWGQVYHSDGSLCTHLPPQTNQIVLLNDTDMEILTEEAPKWGDPDPNIPGNGYQGCELGNFDNPAISPGDSFTVIFTCLASEEQGISHGLIPELPAPAGVNVNIQLTKSDFPSIPTNVKATYDSSQNKLTVRWDPIENASYRLYRHKIDDKGEYNRIASDLTAPIYIDTNVHPDSIYGYIVIAIDHFGRISGHSREVGNFKISDFVTDATDNSSLNNNIPLEDIKVLAFQKDITLNPGESRQLRIIRGVVAADGDLDGLYAQCMELLDADLQRHLQTNEEQYRQIPAYNFDNPDIEMMYWSAFNLIHQCMMPPEGECSYNYYLFSREPTWGWGHGGQVFHESLAMLAYAFMDAESAMNSQRVFMERQWDNGYIPYRTGPYLNETIYWAGDYTSSAPWFSWENWEIFQISRDTTFLREAYNSGIKFYNYWIAQRDIDKDNLCEWGAHAVLECVRDGQAVIWDKVGWPSNFECLDLNCILVKEAKALAAMANVLGKTAESQSWKNDAAARSELINHLFWDTEDKFYYHIDRDDHDFTFQQLNDLKRQEIIGFLPLWAGVASAEQAEFLVSHLTNPDKFQRNYGVPSLAADDPYFNSMGYWNGPVWVEWNYLIFRGLLDYGYYAEAESLANRIFDNVIYQLKTNHWFWELYSPDHLQAGWHKAYIWSGLVARMVIDLQEYQTAVENKPLLLSYPTKSDLRQNFPNPFNPATKISYQISLFSKVELSIYDALGRKIRTLLDTFQSAGKYQIEWDGKNAKGQQVASGMYICRLRINQSVISKKMIMIR